MIVADASALVVAVVDTGHRGAHVRKGLADGAITPHLADAEVGQAIRGLVLRQHLDAEAGRRSIVAAHRLVTDRVTHGPLLSRAWELRDNVSFYDGLYVALAELMEVTLHTADQRLAVAHGPRCEIELV